MGLDSRVPASMVYPMRMRALRPCPPNLASLILTPIILHPCHAHPRRLCCSPPRYNLKRRRQGIRELTLLDQKCLLAVFAHPDDEDFGTGGILRKYADEGVKTAL